MSQFLARKAQDALLGAAPVVDGFEFKAMAEAAGDPVSARLPANTPATLSQRVAAATAPLRPEGGRRARSRRRRRSRRARSR